jgi:cytochrome c-type biogenesis protein CcmH/NrfF
LAGAAREEQQPADRELQAQTKEVTEVIRCFRLSLQSEAVEAEAEMAMVMAV